MEPPWRSMLRRPIGLLPSATMRAENTPETMGHASVLLMPAAEQSSTMVQAPMEGAEINPTATQVACAAAMLPVARAEPVSSSAYPSAALVQVSAVPLAIGHEVAQANSMLPWGQLAKEWCSTITVCDEQLVQLQERTVVVEAGRAKSLTRKQVTHFKCLCCRKLFPKADGRTCPKCGFTQPESSQLAISERDAARFAARSNTEKGRRRNSQRGANVPQHSLAVAPVSAFEREWQVQLEAKKQRISDETDALTMQRCGLAYVETEDARAAVMESFIQVRMPALCAYLIIHFWLISLMGVNDS